jgi:endonuclease YncB( thermonuclease family)
MRNLKLLFGLSGAILLSSALLVGCNTTTDDGDKTGDQIDYVHTAKEVRLTHDYKDASGNIRDFYTDGITQVTVKPSGYIDGDTTHFTPLGGTTTLIKSRYYGVDTPESTGQVEPYGNGAKQFTHDKLEEAAANGTVVVTSTSLDAYTAPETDSTGSRYLSMIWINTTTKDAPYGDLYLLNLWIVQEGFSYVKAVDKFPSFADTFYAAEAQAKTLKLNLFSGEDDPDYNYGNYQDASLLDIRNEVIKTIEDSTHVNSYNNKKVRIRGTVAGFTNHILYLQSSFTDETTGEVSYAGINVFCGMSSIPSKYSIPNTYIQLCGLALQSENFGFQITSVYNFPKASSTDERDAKVLYKASEIPEEYELHVFEDGVSSLSGFASGTPADYLFSPFKLTDTITATGGYDSSDSTKEITLYTNSNGKSNGFTVYIPFLYQPDPNDSLTKWSTFESYKGHTFELTGILTYRKTTKGDIKLQFVVRDSSDIVLIS